MYLNFGRYSGGLDSVDSVEVESMQQKACFANNAVYLMSLSTLPIQTFHSYSHKKHSATLLLRVGTGN